MAQQLADRRDIDFVIWEQFNVEEELLNKGYEAYKMGKATNMAAHLEIDAVIDPAETRRWIISGLDATDE